MTYTRYSRPILSCDDPLCLNEFSRPYGRSEPDDLRRLAGTGGWLYRDHHDYCRKHRYRNVRDTTEAGAPGPRGTKPEGELT